MKTDVAVFDSHRSLRNMLSLVLAKEGCYNMVGEAGTGCEAVRICRKMKPQLVILELLLPEMNGIQVLRTVRADAPDTRILVYSGVESRDLIMDALRERPNGFVRKQDSLNTVCEAVRVVSNGGAYFTAFATSLREPPFHVEMERCPLTEREHSVLQMIAEGRRNKEIAALLGVSPKTAEHHRANLMEKLGIHEVAALTLYAVRKGLVDAERI